MDTRKLATFIDLAQTCNYSRTAENIFQLRPRSQNILWRLKRLGGHVIYA